MIIESSKQRSDDKFRSRKSPMLLTIPALIVASGVVVFGVLEGCVDPGGNADIETEQSALGTFGSWVSTSSPLIYDAAAVARVGSTTWTAFGLDGNFKHVIWSRKSNGQWTGQWSRLMTPGIGGSSGSGPDPTTFTDRPAAVGFDVSSGPLFNRYAIVARQPDNMYYIRIQDQTSGSIVQNWAPIGTGIYASAPAVAFVPANSPAAPKNTLVVVGLGLDNKYYESRNTLLSGNVYSHAAWTGPFLTLGNQTFDSAPALTYACPPNANSYSLVVVGRVLNTNVFFSNRHEVSNWMGWVTVNGIFSSGPAVAAGCGEFSSETTIYGRGSGSDKRIWVGVYVPGTPESFAPIGSTQFVGNPTAAGFSTTVMVGANTFGGGGGNGLGSTQTNGATSP